MTSMLIKRMRRGRLLILRKHSKTLLLALLPKKALLRLKLRKKVKRSLPSKLLLLKNKQMRQKSRLPLKLRRK